MVVAFPVQAQDPTGVWTGTVNQPGSRSGSYPMRMTLESARGGSIDYPSLGCGGTVFGGCSGGNYTYTEKIEYGRDRCIDGGSIHLVLQGENAFWEWSGSGAYASARLRRVGGGPRRASCGECGQALLNDVAAGLKLSQGMRSYMHEALAKYDNCRQGLPGSCTDQCAYQLRQTLPNCDRWSEGAAYRACAETSYTGAQAYCR
jgi:hypothetical protein